MQETAATLQEKFPGAVTEVLSDGDETTLIVAASSAKGILASLKQDHGFNYLADLSSAHWPEEARIDVVWMVRNLESRQQLRIRVPLPEEDPVIETVSDLWKAANWLEREVFDLMGVRFEGHPGLKRIMLPDDFEGHPLRKEYPVEGFDEWRNYLPPEGEAHE
ncbi:MAG: NADH-quinone oxidoreductase subunit C [Acidobacteriota bacterium]|jgi:NADH-quinone oxidoreductase subunit C